MPRLLQEVCQFLKIQLKQIYKYFSCLDGQIYKPEYWENAPIFCMWISENRDVPAERTQNAVDAAYISDRALAWRSIGWT